MPTKQSPIHPLYKELPATPSPSKPRHLRLNHKVLSTVYESPVDEQKALEMERTRWSIRPVAKDEKEPDTDLVPEIASLHQDEEEKHSLNSQSSAYSSQHKTSLTSTDPTTACESEICSNPTTTSDYKDAYQQYRLVSLKSRKLTIATNLHVTLDKTQMLTNQLHVSIQPLNLLNTILHRLSGSSTTLEDLKERAALQIAASNNETEEIRTTIRILLTTNQTLIRECEVLLRDATISNLDLFTQERLAVNRLLTTLASDKNTTVDKDDDLECQQETLVAFNDYVSSLVQSLEEQDKGLENLIREVNQEVTSLEENINVYVKDKKSLKNMVRKMLGLGGL